MKDKYTMFSSASQWNHFLDFPPAYSHNMRPGRLVHQSVYCSSLHIFCGFCHHILQKPA